MRTSRRERRRWASCERPCPLESRAVVLVDSLIQSLAGVHLVQGVDAVVLAVHVGDMDLEALTSSVAIIGPDRILGSFTAPSAP